MYITAPPGALRLRCGDIAEVHCDGADSDGCTEGSARVCVRRGHVLAIDEISSPNRARVEFVDTGEIHVVDVAGPDHYDLGDHAEGCVTSICDEYDAFVRVNTDADSGLAGSLCCQKTTVECDEEAKFRKSPRGEAEPPVAVPVVVSRSEPNRSLQGSVRVAEVSPGGEGDARSKAGRMSASVVANCCLVSAGSDASAEDMTATPEDVAAAAHVVLPIVPALNDALGGPQADSKVTGGGVEASKASDQASTCVARASVEGPFAPAGAGAVECPRGISGASTSRIAALESTASCMVPRRREPADAARSVPAVAASTASIRSVAAAKDPLRAMLSEKAQQRPSRSCLPSAGAPASYLDEAMLAAVGSAEAGPSSGSLDTVAAIGASEMTLSAPLPAQPSRMKQRVTSGDAVSPEWSPPQAVAPKLCSPIKKPPCDPLGELLLARGGRDASKHSAESAPPALSGFSQALSRFKTVGTTVFTQQDNGVGNAALAELVLIEAVSEAAVAATLPGVAQHASLGCTGSHADENGGCSSGPTAVAFSPAANGLPEPRRLPSTRPARSVWEFLGETPAEDEAALSQQEEDALAADFYRVLQDGGDGVFGNNWPESWTEHAVEVSEFPLVIGPFTHGRRGEVLQAWIASSDDSEATVNVTEIVRRRWTSQAGLLLPNLTEVRKEAGCPPVPGAVLHVKYRLTCVPAWNVSRASYAEGVGRLVRLAPIVAKSLANVVGATLATSGYLLAKATKLPAEVMRGPLPCRRSTPDLGVGSDIVDGGIADSDAFLWGFTSWMRLNGIKPSVHYEPTGRDAVRLRWFLAQTLEPSELPREVAPPEDMRQTPLIVANHISYLDPIVLVPIFGVPRVIAKAGIVSLPIIGRFAREIGVIEVDRSCRESRSSAIDAIAEHSRKWKPGRRPLLLFPEGTTSNGASLLDFKKGAFVPGMPVRPVVMCYTGDWDPASTSFRLTSDGDIAPTSDAEWAGEFLGNIVHSVRVRVLPPYCPSEDERSKPEKYAANVRKLMATAYANLQREVKSGNNLASNNLCG